MQVSFSLDAQQQAQQHSQRLKQDVLALVEQCLAQDPKPAYQKPEPTRQYGVKTLGYRRALALPKRHADRSH